MKDVEINKTTQCNKMLNQFTNVNECANFITFTKQNMKIQTFWCINQKQSE